MFSIGYDENDVVVELMIKIKFSSKEKNQKNNSMNRKAIIKTTKIIVRNITSSRICELINYRQLAYI